MNSEISLEQIVRPAIVIAFSVFLSACGGDSDNRSPGSIVVEVPVDGGTPPVDPNQPPIEPPPGGGDTVVSVIPADLQNAIAATGQTTPGGREIYNIDVSQLPNGRLDPTGVLLGNDVVFRITGGALRVGQN